MKLTKLASAGLAVAVSTLAISGVAYAQAPAATPSAINVVACVEASVRVDTLGKAANDAADALDAVTNVNAKLQADVDAAVAALTTATKGLQAASTLATIAEAQKVAAAAQVKLTDAVTALLGSAQTSTQKTALVDARAKLQAAIDAANKACADDSPVTTTPATPSPTVTPTPTVSPIPTTTTHSAPPPVFDNGVTTAPSGGVETGYGPA